MSKRPRNQDTTGALRAELNDRARDLACRDRDLRLVLDNVDQGFLTVFADGRLGQERSKIVDRWFGPSGSDATFVRYMGAIDPQFAELFALGLEALLEGVLPRELCLEQLPRRFQYHDRHFRCQYVPLTMEERLPREHGAGAPLEALLVVIRDITLELRAARYEAEGTEILALFEAWSRDRPSAMVFFKETSDQLSLLRGAPLESQKRLIHTIKGNCSLMGISVLADLCHALEGQIFEFQRPADDAALGPLSERWRELTKALQTFGADHGRYVVELPIEEIERLEHDLALGAPLAHIQERLTSWRLEPAERPLARLGNHARKLAARLGKGDLDVLIDGGNVHLAAPVWAALWSDVVHVVRNAIDHGIESTVARRRAGKPARPQLKLATQIEHTQLIIEVADDGAGIDWTAVKNAARERGLPHQTEADLVDAIFAPDLTTRAQATVISGRGMGLAAVRQRVEAAGGAVALTTSPGQGTTFRFTIPFPDSGVPAAIKAVTAHVGRPASAVA